MYTTSLRCLLAAVFLNLLLACRPAPDLGPLPEINLSLYPAAIQTQLGDAYAAVKSKPDTAATNGKLAMLLHTYDQAESAAVFYERAALLDDDEFRWPYLLAWVQSDLGQNDRALATMRRALMLNPGYVRGQIKVAELLLDMGHLDECRKELDRLITRFPDRAAAYFMLGQLENRVGQPAQAITAFRTVHKISGDFGALHYGFAQSYRQIGDQASAARHAALYEQHKNLTVDIEDPVFVEMERLNISETALIERAKKLAQRGDNDSAIRLLTKALKTNPDSFAAHITLVGLFAARRQFDKADAQLDIARQLDPHHPSLYYNTGIARLAEERWTEAERAFRRSLEIDPKKADAFTQIGLINEIRGQATQAKTNYRAALAIDPWHRQANWLLGRLLLKTGDTPKAIESLERVRSARDPSAPGILIDLASAYEKDGQISKARLAAADARDAAQKFQDQGIVNLATGMLLRLERVTTAEPR